MNFNTKIWIDKHFDCYELGKLNYRVILGNGIEASKGESNKGDIDFSIDIGQGSKTFHVRVYVEFLSLLSVKQRFLYSVVP